MVGREHRAELRVYRPGVFRGMAGTNEPDAFLNKIRTYANMAFGFRGDTRVTLRPPHVPSPINDYAGEPAAKVYDATNIRMALSWRVMAGDSNAGSKFFKAKQALEKGVNVSQKGKVGGALEKRPLLHQLAEASQEFELGPNASFTVVCNSIMTFRHALVHPGTDIFCLVPDQGTPEYLSLLREQQVTEEALADASGYVYNKQNPQTGLVLPFMRIPSTTGSDERQDFFDLIGTNPLQVRVSLGPVAIAMNNE